MAGRSESEDERVRSAVVGGQEMNAGEVNSRPALFYSRSQGSDGALLCG